MAITLHYFTEFGKPVFQHITASTCIELIVHLCSKHSDRPMSYDEEHRPVVEFMCQYVVFCSTCTMLSLKKVHIRYLIS